MILEALSLTNFRNHSHLDLELPRPGMPLYISGPNGAGKTSIIEAIYMLFTLRTFRGQPLSDIKSFGSEFLRISGIFAPNDSDVESAVLFYQNERKFLINNQTDYLSAADYSYITPVICYSPSFETILSSEHSERRQSIDRIIYYTDKFHMQRVKHYNILMQRKRAELDNEKPDKTVLSIINEQLIPVSDEISSARLNLIEEINRSIKNFPEMSTVMMPDTELSLSVSSLQGKDLGNELDRQRPLYGSHKDLLYVKKNGKIIEKFQSFGQKKSCLLLLLYHMALIVQKSRKSDILLLCDDFEAGLDDIRAAEVKKLIALLMENTQVLLTGISNKHYTQAEELKL